MRRFAYATRIPYGSLGKYFCHTCRKWFLFFFFFGINKRRTQTKQTKETASLTNDHKQREGKREKERANRENKAPLHLMSYRGRQRELLHTHTHTHTVRAKIFCIEYSAQRKTIENHLSNILYCLLQPFSIDRIQLFILEHATAKATIVCVFALKNWELSHWFLHICIIIIIYISLCVFIYMFFIFWKPQII